ncbi:hypothetical protein ACB098_11G018400 [Castanea mollissima]
MYKPKSTHSNLPPGKKGWLIIGETSEFAMEKMVVFCGASGNKFLFSNKKKCVISWWPHSVEKVMLSPKSLESFVPEDSVKARRAIEHLEADWSPYKQLKVLPLSMNITDPNHVTRFSDLFSLITHAYNRVIKAGKVVRQEFLEVIKQWKKEISENIGIVARDFLTHTLLALDKNGRFMNDMLIATNIMALLIGDHDTTTSAITFMLKYLADFPHQMEIARSKGLNNLLNWDDIKKMKYSWNVACETIRLTPPIAGTFRILWSPYSTHKNLKYFPGLEKFDPLRFEKNDLAPYTFVPFGGGPRICPGREYARLEILIFIHNVVTRFKWEKAILDEKITYKPSLILENGKSTANFIVKT